MRRFTVTLEEDEFGELILPIPDEVVEELGWAVGDELEYDLSEDQALRLRKVDE